MNLQQPAAFNCIRFRQSLVSATAVVSIVCLIAVYLILFYFFGGPRVMTSSVPATATTCQQPRAAATTDDSRSDRFLFNICNSALRVVHKHTSLRHLFANSTLSADYYVNNSANCDCFRQQHGYLTDDDVTPEERGFPIAFSLLAYENVQQTERLLRLIYRPHNVYCIHVDRKAPELFHKAIGSIANCLDNVFVAKPAVDVVWGTVSVVDAELLCMKQLLAYAAVSWKYFINLVGRDFPLRTNGELVKILKTYNGSNDIQGSRKRGILHRSWFKYRWHDISSTDYEPKPPAPHGFNVAKGSTHMAATRQFVEFAVYDRRAVDLHDWMKDIRNQDELFFSTLNHNPQHKVPGSFTGELRNKESTLTRVKHWQPTFCSGRYIRFICSISLADLPWVVSSPELFANKIRQEMDPLAFHCLELWYMQRARSTVGRHGNSSGQQQLLPVGYKFNLEFYANQTFVKEHI